MWGNAAGEDGGTFAELIVGKFSADCLCVLVIGEIREVEIKFLTSVLFISWVVSDYSFHVFLLHR